MRRSQSSADEVSDEILLAGMADGDDRAALAFVRRYQRRVFGLAISMVGDFGAAEEIAQEAFLRAWRHTPVFDPRRGSVTTWLLTITRNLSIDSLRIRRSTPMNVEALMEVMKYEVGPDAYWRSDHSQLVRSALATLPVEQRRALVLSVMYGYTAEEVGQVENIPLGTAKSRIRAGLAKFHDEVTKVETSR